MKKEKKNLNKKSILWKILLQISKGLGSKKKISKNFFKYEPIYNVTWFVKFLHGDPSEISTLKKLKEILWELKSENP